MLFRFIRGLQSAFRKDVFILSGMLFQPLLSTAIISSGCIALKAVNSTALQIYKLF